MRIGIFGRCTRIHGSGTLFDGVFELFEFVLDFRNSSATVSILRNKGNITLSYSLDEKMVQ